MPMPKRTPQDWEDLERELHAAGVSPGEIEAGTRDLLARARGQAPRHQHHPQRRLIVRVNSWWPGGLLVQLTLRGSGNDRLRPARCSARAAPDVTRAAVISTASARGSPSGGSAA